MLLSSHDLYTKIVASLFMFRPFSLTYSWSLKLMHYRFPDCCSCYYLNCQITSFLHFIEKGCFRLATCCISWFFFVLQDSRQCFLRTSRKNHRCFLVLQQIMGCLQENRTDLSAIHTNQSNPFRISNWFHLRNLRSCYSPFGIFIPLAFVDAKQQNQSLPRLSLILVCQSEARNLP